MATKKYLPDNAVSSVYVCFCVFNFILSLVGIVLSGGIIDHYIFRSDYKKEMPMREVGMTFGYYIGSIVIMLMFLLYRSKVCPVIPIVATGLGAGSYFIAREIQKWVDSHDKADRSRILPKEKVGRYTTNRLTSFISTRNCQYLSIGVWGLIVAVGLYNVISVFTNKGLNALNSASRRYRDSRGAGAPEPLSADNIEMGGQMGSKKV